MLYHIFQIYKNQNKEVCLKDYTIFFVLNVPEDGATFTNIFIDFLRVYDNTYYAQIILESCAYKIANKQVIDYLDDNLFELMRLLLLILINGCYTFCIEIELM